MATLWGKSYTRQEILSRVGSMDQLAEAWPFELADGNQHGTRGVHLRNAAGLEFSVVTDRGMAITGLTFKGVPLPFVSSVGSAHPSFYDPLGPGWLRSWPGGFLTPCGMTQVGAPAVEDGKELGLHGRVGGIPARNVSWGGEWEKDDYQVWVEGTVRETAVFNENLVLHRRIWTRLNEPRFWIEDRVENQGFEPAPHMFLQHINLGFPLVDRTTRLELPPHQTQARDAAAAPGLDTCLEFGEPEPGYQEQVFYHTLEPDDQGMVEVRLVNPAFDDGRGLGCSLRYTLADYPVFVEWKMMGDGLYVVGIEPGNCHVEGRVKERERGKLQVLAPGETRSYQLEIGFF